MKKTLRPLLLSVFFLLPAKAQVFVEAEEFDSYGHWSLDQQFIGTMGSAYLLAHGAGVPVGDAKTSVAVPENRDVSPFPLTGPGSGMPSATGGRHGAGRRPEPLNSGRGVMSFE